MKNLLRPLALATQLGVTMGLLTVATVLGGLFLGLWLDRQFGTRPLATLLFILVGVLAGLLGMIHLAQATARQLNDAAVQQVEARAAFSARDLGRALALVVRLILVTVLPIGLGLWLGISLDGLAHSSPVFTIMLSAAGVVGALVGAYAVGRRTSRNP